MHGKIIETKEGKMNENIYNYFADLKRVGIVDEMERMIKNGETGKPFSKVTDNVEIFRFGNGSYFLKTTDNTHAIASVASSKMYKAIGIATPPVFLLKNNDKQKAQTIQQNASEILGLASILAQNDLKYAKINRKVFGKFKWEMFYDAGLQDVFLNFITPDCFEQLQSIFLVDEIRTDMDRHLRNYFFVKRKESSRYEGVVAIDLEQMVIYNFCGETKDDFSNFLVTPYASATPHQAIDEASYFQRVQQLREIIQDGVLSERNIHALVDALKYDFPGDFKKTSKERKLHGKDKKKIVSPIERLWEYNNKTIGKDLGI